MGVFKPLLPFGDETVIEACLRTLRDAGIDEIVVVLGHRAEEVRRRLAGRKLIFAVNDEAESEMSVSIARGTEKLSGAARAVLIALVDQPAVPPEAIRSLLTAYHSTQARLVVPQWNKRGGHPVLVDLCYHDELLKLDSRNGLRGLFDAHAGEVRRVPVASPYVARDMDTWDDYRTLHEEIFRRPPPVAPPFLEEG